MRCVYSVFSLASVNQWWNKWMNELRVCCTQCENGITAAVIYKTDDDYDSLDDSVNHYY